tara:strand:+ start:976 stop:1434 length:459 start_codon:yes stop_codon:yes gene_type:complete
MITENLKLSGQLNIVLKDKAGNIKDEREVKNLVVTTGLAFIASRMVGTAKNVMSHMALGSSATAAAAGQTDLVSVLGSREVLDSTTISGTNDEKVVFVSSFEAGDGTGAVTEAGIFNASSSGDMLCRTVFSVVNKSADDTMSITWTVTIAAS